MIKGDDPYYVHCSTGPEVLEIIHKCVHIRTGIGLQFISLIETKENILNSPLLPPTNEKVPKQIPYPFHPPCSPILYHVFNAKGKKRLLFFILQSAHPMSPPHNRWSTYTYCNVPCTIACAQHVTILKIYFFNS
jgi:hypothetical protein